MDLLDILAGKAGKVLTASYYGKTLPRDKNEGRIAFEYEYIDGNSWYYQKLLGGLDASTAASAAIKTNAPIEFAVGDHLVLQDGRLFVVVLAQKDYNAASRQAFRYLSQVAGVETVLRLIEKQNPWGWS